MLSRWARTCHSCGDYTSFSEHPSLLITPFTGKFPLQNGNPRILFQSTSSLGFSYELVYRQGFNNGIDTLRCFQGYKILGKVRQSLKFRENLLEENYTAIKLPSTPMTVPAVIVFSAKQPHSKRCYVIIIIIEH